MEMKTISLVLLRVASAQNAESTLYFEHIGLLNPSPSFGHIHFVMDSDLIMKLMLDLEDSIDQIRMVVKTNSQPSGPHYTAFFLKNATVKLLQSLEEPHLISIGS